MSQGNGESTRRGAPLLSVEQIPSIIAFSLQEHRNDHDPVLKLWHACDVVELFLRFTVMVGVADLRRRGEIHDKVLRELRPRIEEPTLGKWKGMALALARAMELHHSAVPELPAYVNTVLVPLLDGPDGSRSPTRSLGALRNHLAHGGGVTKALAAKLLEAWGSRFEQALSQAGWLTELDLVVDLVKTTGETRYGTLRGPLPNPLPFHPDAPGLEGDLAAAFVRGDEVVLVRGATVLPLWPMSLYGPPKSSDPELEDAFSPTTQVYVRRGDVCLQLTPVGSEEVCQSEADQSALDVFSQIFCLHERTREAASKRFEVRGFEPDLRRDAGHLIGRAAELERLGSLVRERSRDVLWLFGAPGMGKSVLLSRFAVELIDEAAPDVLVLAYRFKAGDDRCARGPFLRFCVERLEVWLGDGSSGPAAARASTKELSQQVRALIAALDGRRVVFIVDGLDEVTRNDPQFAEEVVLALAGGGVTWLCAGRPERELAEVFTADRCVTVFDHGLPPMGSADIRSMLLEKIGPLRKRLIRSDRDDGDQVVNPFIERVARCAEGVPLYVSYVIGDILSNRLRVLDAGERLPPTLDRYHEELLRRCSIGTLHQAITPLASLLAVAREPLSATTLTDIMVRAKLIPDDDEPQEIVCRALSTIASMLRRSPTPEGGEGFMLFHTTLREHMEKSPLTRGALSLARRHLADLAAHAELPHSVAGPYLFRWGLTHLVELDRTDEALSALTDLAYLVGRLETLPGPSGVRGVSDDWRNVLEVASVQGDDLLWEEHWRTHEHLLLLGTERWPSHKILWQLAWGHAAKSPISGAAARSQRSLDPWIRLSNVDRPGQVRRSPCLFSMIGPTGAVEHVVSSADGARAVTAGGGRGRDRDIRVWDLASHRCLRVLAGHDAPVTALALDAGGERCAAGDRAGAIRLWNVGDGSVVEALHAEGAAIVGLGLASPEPRLVSADAAGRVALHHLESVGAQPRLLWEGPPVRAFACDGELKVFIVAHDRGALLLRDDSADARAADLADPPSSIRCVAVSLDGSVGAAGSDDGWITTWDLVSGEPRARWKTGDDAVACLALGANGGLVLAGFDRGPSQEYVVEKSITIWTAEGVLVTRLEGHNDAVLALSLDAGSERALSGGLDRTVKQWDLTMSEDRRSATGELLWVNDIVPFDGGRRCLTGSEDRTLRVWDLESRECLARFGEHALGVWAVDVTWDGALALSASEDRTLKLWDLRGNRMIATLEGHEAPINKAVISPSGRLAVSGAGRSDTSAGASAKVWDLAARACLISLDAHDGKVQQVGFTPDERRIVTASWDGKIKTWDISRGELCLDIDTGQGRLRGLAIAPDGRRVASGDQAGGLRVWDLAAGSLVQELIGHEANVRRAAISPDGRRLLSGGDDHSVRLWDLETGDLLAAAFFGAFVTALSFIGRGDRLLVGLSNGRFHVLCCEQCPEPAALLVTPTRRWRLDASCPTSRADGSPGRWDDGLTIVCPGCGALAAVEGSTREAAPVILCTGCHARLQVTPFTADLAGEPRLSQGSHTT